MEASFDQYVIKVDPKNIGTILSILKDNDVIDLVKVTKVTKVTKMTKSTGEVIENIESDVSVEESDAMIHEITNDKCVSCWFENKITKKVKMCTICEQFFCETHCSCCNFCRGYVCDNDITLSFRYNHSTGDVVCKQCD